MLTGLETTLLAETFRAVANAAPETAKVCASQLVIHLLGLTVAEQSLQYRQADYKEVPYLRPLMYLHHLVVMGVCRATEVLEDTELPPLEPYLQQLPEPMRTRVRAAIEAERRGECDHGVARPMVVREAEAFVRSMVEQQQQLQLARSAA